MAITIQHTPATLVGTMAAEAGRVQGRDRQMSRDMQLTQMMMAAGERGADQASARAAKQQAYEFQRGLIAEASRVRRPGQPTGQKRPAADQREQFGKVIAEAEQAGIFEDQQVKRMKLLNSLGDFEGIRRIIAAKPPTKRQIPTTERERETKRQIGVIKTRTKQGVALLQKEIEKVEAELQDVKMSDGSPQYPKRTRDFMRENPEFIPLGAKPLFDKQQQLQQQITKVTKQASSRLAMLEYGITVSEQLDLELTQQEKAGRTAERALDRSQRQAGRLTETQELGIDMTRDTAKGLRTRLTAENKRLRKDAEQYEDEDEDDFVERIVPIHAQIKVNDDLIMRTFAQEKKAVGRLIQQDKVPPQGKTFTDSTGQKWEFVRYKTNGQPGYRRVQGEATGPSFMDRFKEQGVR